MVVIGSFCLRSTTNSTSTTTTLTSTSHDWVSACEGCHTLTKETQAKRRAKRPFMVMKERSIRHSSSRALCALHCYYSLPNPTTTSTTATTTTRTAAVAVWCSDWGGQGLVVVVVVQ